MEIVSCVRTYVVCGNDVSVLDNKQVPDDPHDIVDDERDEQVLVDHDPIALERTKSNTSKQQPQSNQSNNQQLVCLNSV